MPLRQNERRGVVYEWEMRGETSPFWMTGFRIRVSALVSP
jgi:hypothetical protein